MLYLCFVHIADPFSECVGGLLFRFNNNSRTLLTSTLGRLFYCCTFPKRHVSTYKCIPLYKVCILNAQYTTSVCFTKCNSNHLCGIHFNQHIHNYKLNLFTKLFCGFICFAILTFSFTILNSAVEITAALNLNTLS